MFDHLHGKAIVPHAQSLDKPLFDCYSQLDKPGNEWSQSGKPVLPLLVRGRERGINLSRVFQYHRVDAK